VEKVGSPEDACEMRSIWDSLALGRKAPMGNDFEKLMVGRTGLRKKDAQLFEPSSVLVGVGEVGLNACDKGCCRIGRAYESLGFQPSGIRVLGVRRASRVHSVRSTVAHCQETCAADSLHLIFQWKECPGQSQYYV